MNNGKKVIWTIAGIFLALLGVLIGVLCIVFMPVIGANFGVNRYRKSVNNSIDHQINVAKLKETKYSNKESAVNEQVAKYQTALNDPTLSLTKTASYTTKLNSATKKANKYSIRADKYKNVQSILANSPQRKETTKVNDFVNKIADKVSTNKSETPTTTSVTEPTPTTSTEPVSGSTNQAVEKVGKTIESYFDKVKSLV